MAVELRCPECRAKLRLKEAPEPGTDIECPKCGHDFPAPETDDEAPAPKKKPAPTPEKKVNQNLGMKAAPKKRRAIKHKSDPRILIAVIIGGLVLLALIVTVLIWYMGRKSVAVEMMMYLPDDVNIVYGANVGHIHKYPEVFKLVEPTYANLPFKKAADMVGQAVGIEGREWLDYAITGSSKGGGGNAIVLRSKKEFDPAALSKLPGAKESSSDGGKFYTVSSVDGLGAGARVFAPTNRHVVFCSASVAQGTFSNMMKGNKDNAKAFPERMGAIGKRMSKGTIWVVQLYDAPPPKADEPASGTPGGSEPQADFNRLSNSLFSSSKGYGLKASLGSRAVRFELAWTCRDKEAASELSKKYNDSAWSKGDDEEPPREWKYMKGQVGDQKVAREIYSNFGFTSSGEVFVVRTECDTKILMTSMSGLIGKLTGSQGGGGGPGGGPPLPGGGSQRPGN